MDAIDYALLFVGVRYTWAGNTVEDGFDCSGFMQEVLASQGVDPRGDQTAQQLYDHYSKTAKYNGLISIRNDVLFFGKSTTQISHIAMAIDPINMIESGGEGRVSTSNGMVRVRPISNRKDLVAVLKVL